MSGWIDLNRDGDFNDTGEKVISDRSITNTTVSTTSVPITTPSTASKLIPGILIFLIGYTLGIPNNVAITVSKANISNINILLQLNNEIFI
ncbi:hypothetical protein NIES592_10395 [Fischerella major NIES-592]|uniref:GEVED domain-containing protein n=1 Tax=Fischerella major NIES-592 TaxID=210994 RepID=A0A1U7H0N5_9CYAN|nr:MULTISPECIES: GEVED domain-containing protein [Fischerella]OKH14455.1 hypothetical protein NIES592_10395 [Fischerella major NIES-592]